MLSVNVKNAFGHMGAVFSGLALTGKKRVLFYQKKPFFLLKMLTFEERLKNVLHNDSFTFRFRT